MNVYIEYVLIENVVFNSLILYMVIASLRLKLRKFELILGAVVGAALTIVVTLLNLNTHILNIIKIATACLIVFIGVRTKNCKIYLLALLMFFVYTFALGGAIIGLFYLFNIDFQNAEVLTYISSIPIGLYVLGIFLVALAIYNIVHYINQKRVVETFSVDVKVEIEQKTYQLKGYLDSGNSLSHNNLPVCIVENKDIKKVIIDKYAKNLLVRQADIGVIKFATLAEKNCNLAILKVKNLVVNGKTFEVYLGTTFQKKSVLSYDILLNAKMLD